MNKSFYIKTVKLITIAFCMFANTVYADSKRILIIQHQSLQTYEEIYQGFISTMDNGHHFLRYNANGNLNQLNNFIKTIEGQNYDLIFTIGSYTSKYVTEQIKTIPIVISGLSSPEGSGLIPNWKSSGSNYTGAEIQDSKKKMLGVILSVYNPKSMGLIYIKSAPSHIGTKAELLDYCKQNQINLVALGIDNRDENKARIPGDEVGVHISKALDEILPQVDMFFVQLSNTFVENFEIFKEKFIQYKKPSIGSSIYFDKGLLISINEDDFEKGKQAGKKARLILQGLEPHNIPFNIPAIYTIQYNESIGVEMGLETPSGIFKHKLTLFLD